MHGELFVELEILHMGIVVEVVFKEIEPLQYICLLDVNTAQDAVPTPFLVDGSLRGRKVLYGDEFFF